MQRLTPLLHGFLRACIEERRQLLKIPKNQVGIPGDAPHPSRTVVAANGTNGEYVAANLCASGSNHNGDGSRKEGMERNAPEAALIDALFEVEGEGEDQMDKDEMLMLAFELMMAGTDTTTVTLEWALAELAQHPDMLEKVRAEVDAAYAKSASAAAQNGTTAAGGSDSKINAWALAHDPTVWINPHKFDPSRFLGPDAPDLTGQNFSLLTFGSGRRGCLGLNLAMDLSARLLANIVRRFDFELPEDVRAAGGVGLTEHFALTVMLAKPLRVVLRERKGVAEGVVADAGA
ncbi:unnamed protein product [Closterium sp. NIES-64]|nr:unnamed protein product [Closterium sp. NIES-64]